MNAKYENYLKPAGITPGKYRVEIGECVNCLIYDKNGRIPIGADGKPKQPRVIRIVQKATRVEAHLVYDVEDAAKILITPESVQAGAGVDMGLKDQAITNDGTFYSKRVVDRRREKRLQRRMNRLRNLALPKAKSATSRRAKKILAEKERACWMPQAHWERRDGRNIVVWDTPDGSPTNAYRKTRALYAKEKQRQAEREVNAAHRVSADIVNAVLARGGSVIASKTCKFKTCYSIIRLPAP